MEFGAKLSAVIAVKLFSPICLHGRRQYDDGGIQYLNRGRVLPPAETRPAHSHPRWQYGAGPMVCLGDAKSPPYHTSLLFYYANVGSSPTSLTARVDS